MAEATTASLAIAIVALILIALLTVPGSIKSYQRLTRQKQYQEVTEKYEDEDGVAVEDSQAAFSTLISCILILVLVVLGDAVSLVGAILATLRPDAKLPVESWLQFAAWAFLTLQGTATFIASPYFEQSELGLYSFFSSAILIAAIVVENVFLFSIGSIPEPRNLHITLTAVQLGVASILLVTNVCIPRRPDVYVDGQIVDRMNTVSILGKMSFAWPTAVLDKAAKVASLEVSDLPKPHNQYRAKTLRESWEKITPSDPVWKKVIKSHRVALTLQWILTAIVNVTNFGPQLVLFFILRTLEDRDAGFNVAGKLWGLAAALGAVVAATSWIESWMFWVCFSGLGIPIFEQLAAVVFAKATKKKDVKGTSKKKDKSAADGEAHINEGAGQKGEDLAGKKADEEEDEDDEMAQKTKQSTINLIAVDAKRVADFTSFNYIFFGSAVKLIVAIVFLVNLIGWIPLLCGFVIPVFVIPVNIVAAKRYAAAQDKLMKTRDSKMAVVTEALQGIRQIKFSAMEKQWQKKIMDVRQTELNTQWRVFLYDTTLIGIWILGPVLLAAVSLTVYAIMNRRLNASIAFTTISVFDSIEMVLAVIPELMTEFLDAKVSAERIDKYLFSPDKEQTTEDGDSVAFKNATVAWPSDDAGQDENRFLLRNLDIQFPLGELSVVSGRTGSGKSLLLAAILGEAEVIEGKLTVPKPPLPEERYDDQANKSNWIIPESIAYVSQIPWIENATIKDNILFGLPEDAERYAKVKKFCALEKDFEMLADGELTDIGANGINLSGGQKWRVSFARALYSRAGILVLDDIFSAVDAHVGRHLFEEALTGELGKGRTRILVTHHVALCLPKTKYSVLLEDGTAQYAGTVEELRSTGVLKEILEHGVEEEEDLETEDHEHAVKIDDGGGLAKMMTNASQRSRRDSRLQSNGENGINGNGAPKKADKPKVFNEQEKREKGAIKFTIYMDYIRSSGGLRYWTWIAFVFLCSGVVILARSGWLTNWTRSYATESYPQVNAFVNQKFVLYAKESLKSATIDHSLTYYLGVYVAISVAWCLICTSRYFFIFWASITASRVLFENLTYAVIRAPLRWLDTVPVGRILNRFTGDFNMLDSRISMDLGFMLNNVMTLISVIVAGFFVSPWMILFAGLLLAVCLRFAVRYLAGAREVKRLESTLKSPVYETFGSTLVGIGTIRAFDKVSTYVQRMYTKIDQHNQAYWHLWLFNRWLGFRLNMAGAVFAVVTAFLIVSIKGIDAPLAGFALSFSLEYTAALTFCLRQYANVELDMNAAERIVEYSNIPIEKQEGDPAPAAWPTEGKLEVENLVVSYAPDLPPVLKGLSFSVERNQRVGVVGRTGAGKSSLTLALFRFLEALEGSIHIDGIDISKITLYDLRSRLAIIPQDPVLFSGTVRSNLDAFDERTDTELRDALQRVHLVSTTGTATPSNATAGYSASRTDPAVSTSDDDKNSNIFSSLTSKISEGGLNLSQGQRQLLCLARAIVSRPKIMVLDEATSAVDMATDALIQRSIREEFTDSTLLVIAHRLSTIADFDKILVMGEGKVVEYDSPPNLMKIEGGIFRGMVEQSGEKDELEGIIFGHASTSDDHK